MKLKVAILGSGPSGLMAYWACLNRGVYPQIISDSAKMSIVEGFQYLHEPCGLPLKPNSLLHQIIPNNCDLKVASENYSQKVYDDTQMKNNVRCGYQEIYNLREAINFLYNIAKDQMLNLRITSIADVNSLSTKYDLVFSSIPFNFFFPGNCCFRISFIKHYHDLANLNFCFYDTLPDSVYLRFGTVFNSAFIEAKTQIDADYKATIKVTTTNVIGGGFNENVIRIGRFGAWDKKERIDTTYHKVIKVLDGRTV